MLQKAPLPRRQTRSEFQMILAFIGIRNLCILGIIGCIYCFSSYKNYIDGLGFAKSFNPYYAFHLHDGTRIMNDSMRSIGEWLSEKKDGGIEYLVQIKDRVVDFCLTNIDPFIRAYPIAGVALFIVCGFLVSICIIWIILFILKKVIRLIFYSGSGVLLSKKSIEAVELWSFDPRRKPTDEQLKVSQKNFERLLQRAPAMGGTVPKNADMNIRELALRNKDTEYNFRNAIYVMGPIKAIKLDNSHNIPLALDQIKKLAKQMGMAAIYETIPLDLVILRSKKGTTNWEVDPSAAPVNLGKSYPVQILEKTITQYRNTFIWDERASKVNTKYGLH